MTDPEPSTEPTATARPSGGLLRSSAVVAVGTGLSRVTGLLRTMAIAYALGTALLGDTYNLANNTPNVIYDLVLGGILAATLVPVLVERFERDDQRAIDALATVVTLVLVAVTALAVALSPLIIRLYTVQLPADTADRQTSLAVPLLVMFMPQVLFYGLSTLWTAMLNAKRSFAVPAFAPVLNNVIVICVFLALPHLVNGELTVEGIRNDTSLLLLVGLGTTAGIVAMTLVLWPAMRAAGIRQHWNPDWRHPAVRTIARLSGWTLGYVIANQVVFLLLLTLANGEKGVAAFTYAWQFFQLPYGLLTVSIMVTFTPELASLVTRNDLPGYRARFVQGLRLSLLVMLPAAIAYVCLAEPIVTVLLERGAFGAASTSLTSSVLAWLAVGLPGFGVFLFTMRGFYAFQDTRTPFVLNLGENALQVVLMLVLVGPFGVQGLVAGFSGAYTVAALVAVLVLRRKAGGLGAAGTGAAIARPLVAAGATGLVLFAFSRLFSASGTVGAVVETVLGLTLGAVVYLGALWVLRADEVALLRSVIGGRRRARTRPDDAPMP